MLVQGWRGEDDLKKANRNGLLFMFIYLKHCERRLNSLDLESDTEKEVNGTTPLEK